MRHLKFLLIVNSILLFSCSQEPNQNIPVKKKLQEKSKIVEPGMAEHKDRVPIIEDTSKSQTKKIKSPILDRDYQKPHGGKEIADQPKNFDSVEWKKIQYYDSINRIKK